MNFVLTPGKLKFSDLSLLMSEETHLSLNPNCLQPIHDSAKVITHILDDHQTVYGINTGFGLLANTRINREDLETLQQCIVLSHAAGTGDFLPDTVVRLILALKINSLARGYSGIQLQTIEALIKLYNEKIYPCIPAKGSVGASGDLAPLAHLSAVLIGEGNARFQGKILSAEKALALANLSPLKLAPKEGLALLNGTQASTALAIYSLLAIENIFISALVAGALSVEATKSSHTPFDERIHQIRGHKGQIEVAKMLRDLLTGSEIHASHQHKDCSKVQDPYSLRCQPQVMGACLEQLVTSANTLLVEANAVSDNPLIFTADQAILSGGNFHAEPVAFAADNIALAIAEVGALSERRTALLIDPHFSGLPAFLINNPGINSGFMIAQVTAAALASENKSLAHPASVDSIPTSANQEDHVSMATFAARRLIDMAENTTGIVGIELLAACQGLDFIKPLLSSPTLLNVHKQIREHINFYDKDRFFAYDIDRIKQLIHRGSITQWANLTLF